MSSSLSHEEDESPPREPSIFLFPVNLEVHRFLRSLLSPWQRLSPHKPVTYWSLLTHYPCLSLPLQQSPTLLNACPTPQARTAAPMTSHGGWVRARDRLCLGGRSEEGPSIDPEQQTRKALRVPRALDSRSTGLWVPPAPEGHCCAQSLSRSADLPTEWLKQKWHFPVCGSHAQGRARGLQMALDWVLQQRLCPDRKCGN